MPNTGILLYDFYLNVEGALVGGQRRKLFASIHKIDSVLNTSEGVAVGASCEIMKPGAVVAANVTVTTNTSVTLRHPGWLRNLDQLWVVQSGTLVETVLTAGTHPTWNGATWTINLSVGSGSINLTAGDKLVVKSGFTSGRMVLYDDDTGSSTIANPVTLGPSGTIECYVDDARDVDIIVFGTGLDTKVLVDTPTEGTRMIVSPHDYGALGDGTTDDTIALQMALDYAGGVKGGVMVELLGLSYVVSSPLQPRSNTIILGQGYSTRLIFDLTASGYGIDTNTTAATRVFVGNMRLSGHTNCTAGVRFGGAYSEACRIWADGSITYGVEVTAVDCTVRNSVITSPSSHGAYMSSGSGHRMAVTGNRLISCGGYSAYVTALTSGHLIVGNVSYQPVSGHWFSGVSADRVVTGNVEID